MAMSMAQGAGAGSGDECCGQPARDRQERPVVRCNVRDEKGETRIPSKNDETSWHGSARYPLASLSQCTAGSGGGGGGGGGDGGESSSVVPSQAVDRGRRPGAQWLTRPLFPAFWPHSGR
ncbi:hypothetical protein CMUS01_02664 [Colletotrichum musicola]|uniref:Uncharacterized protein n=1 Tax=Colletotrichum musicola TaxID=2175873 RepID=A0A8H6NUH3_9PEZI|nr:hypothetical protein CMUS01_02664 [Colletotrichum musicola]